MNQPISSLELFSGAGGLAKGLEQAGVAHVGFVEWNEHACHTLRQNYPPDLVHQADINTVNFDQFGPVDLIAGGPPCQPFSLGGKHKGNLDKRDLFPQAIRAINSCQPKAFIFENVKGLLRQSFSSYFEYVLLRLTYPNASSPQEQPWEEHLATLEKIHTEGRYAGLKYNVVFRLLNAADYGIPQVRERVIIVGIRDDLQCQWSFPDKTHSLDALLWSQYVTGTYWQRHDIKPAALACLTPQTRRRAEKLRSIYGFIPPNTRPWQTVRDALGQLPPPDPTGTFHPEHILREGARSYPGHTGSYIDLPAKAIKAGVHGVPGGENMVRYQDGTVRYFTIYEAKKIQTFPDAYQITGAWTEAMRQIGNAVPVQLGQLVAQSLLNIIHEEADPASSEPEPAIA